MKTIADFLAVLIAETQVIRLRLDLEMWCENANADEYRAFVELPLNMESLIVLRDGISSLFAKEIHHCSIEERFNRIHQEHVLSINEFNKLAERVGFIITEQRRPISYVEAARHEGIIQLTESGVRLTPKGEQMAEEVRREVEGEG